MPKKYTQDFHKLAGLVTINASNGIQKNPAINPRIKLLTSNQGKFIETIAPYIIKYAIPLPVEPIISKFRLEYVSASKPTKDELKKYPMILNENNKPISVPLMWSSSTAINGMIKSKKKKPKLL